MLCQSRARIGRSWLRRATMGTQVPPERRVQREQTGATGPTGPQVRQGRNGSHWFYWRNRCYRRPGQFKVLGQVRQEPIGCDRSQARERLEHRHDGSYRPTGGATGAQGDGCGL